MWEDAKDRTPTAAGLARLSEVVVGEALHDRIWKLELSDLTTTLVKEEDTGPLAKLLDPKNGRRVLVEVCKMTGRHIHVVFPWIQDVSVS